MEPKAVQLDYTNWEGKRAFRKVLPIEIFFGKNEWHPQEQWLLRAMDVETNEERTFAMKDIHNWNRVSFPSIISFK